MFGHMTFIVTLLIRQGCFGENWTFTGPDVALHMEAAQGPGTFLNYVADLAVDGNHDSNIQHNHCSHTNEVIGGWWMVDLPSSFLVQGVRIYNRYHLPERLKDFRVIGYPGNVELYNDKLVPVSSKLYLHAVINIPVDEDTRFTSIEVNIPGPYLTLCEVEVYVVTIKCSLNSLRPAEHFYKLNKDYGDSLRYNHSLNATCVPGYERMSGDFVRTCLRNTSLSGEELMCTAFPRKNTESDNSGLIAGIVVLCVLVVGGLVVLVVIYICKRKGKCKGYSRYQ